MRDIKFRVWDKETKHIHIFGDDIHDAITSEGKTNKIYYYNLQNGCDSLDEDSDYVLMQYTGLKDKNGKEIFEGDIVKVNEDIRRVFDLKKIMYVEFGEGTFYLKAEKGIKWNLLRCFPCIVSIEGKMRVEVIGNIYDNPELLEK